MSLFLIAFGILNLLAFSVTAYDKRLAIKNKRRIPEKTLLTFVAIGGTVGSSIAMLLFRHKTSKRAYLIPFFGIILCQIVLLYFGFKKFGFPSF